MITALNIKKLRFLIVGDIIIAQNFHDTLLRKNLTVNLWSPTSEIDNTVHYDVVSVIVDDVLEVKADCIARMHSLFPSALLTVNIDALDLATLHEASGVAALGLNVSYPMEASPFMEIVCTAQNTIESVDLLKDIGISLWGLDPYVSNNISARNYMLAAMTREALHLVEQGYATAESVDRACRNDAGYYLPFTGNFLYMDLMGTAAYAMVMKDLNPELSKSEKLSLWLNQLVEEGKQGMKTGAGIYPYKAGDYEEWKELMDEFSADVAKLINKYKKNYEQL